MKELPAIVQSILLEYINLLNEHLPNALEALYIHGSIALDAYVEGSSDVDFITVLNRRLTKEDIEVITKIHRLIGIHYEKPEMDGVYIQWEDLGKLSSNDQQYPFYNEGKLQFGVHLNPITWTILQSKGIRIVGPEISSLNVEVTKEELVSYVRQNMNGYWVPRIEKLENVMIKSVQMPTNEVNAEIEWSVLGLLRQFYTIKEFDIISKSGAGDYGLVHVPKEWHNIIKEAMNIRMGVRELHIDSDKKRMESALALMKYIINQSKVGK